MAWLRVGRLGLYAALPACVVAAVLSLFGVTPVREDAPDDHAESSLVADYFAFEALFSPMLQPDGLNAAYGQMTQDLAPTRALHRSGRDSLQSTHALMTVRQALDTANGLGATVRLSPARGLYHQMLVNIRLAWTTEQAAEAEWRGARFPLDPTGLRQGAADHSLSWYRSTSDTSLNDAVTVVWRAHQMVLTVAAMRHVAVPDSHLPLPPKPGFRGVQP